MKNIRKYELDILRIWGCILVIISHLVCLVVFDTSYAQWRVANYIYVARNCCVPLFFMLSGILLLNRDYSTYKSLIMSSLKFVIFYIAGATVFYMIRNSQNLSTRSIMTSIASGIQNPSHFWYLAELVGVYLFVPILRKIVSEKRLCKYYLTLWGVYFILLHNVEVWFEISNNDFLSVVANVLSSFHAKEFYTYAGYLVLGYYLFYIYDRYIKWYVWGVLLVGSIVFPALINEWYVSITQTSIPTIWEYNSFSALIQTSCYIIIAKQYLSRIKTSEFMSKSLTEISEATFGIYLIHPIFTEAFFEMMISSNLLFTVPVLALATFCVSAVIVIIARHMKEKVAAIWSTFTLLKKKYLLFIIALWGRAFLIVRFNCGMYADGSWAFIKLLASGKLVDSEEAFFGARKGSMAMIRIFEYVLLHLGITEFNILSFSYSLGCVFWTTLFLSLSIYICYNCKNERILDHSIILWSLILTFVGLYCTHESLLAISILWFVFVCVCNWEQLSNAPAWVGFLSLTLCVCLTGVYESFAIVGFAIILFFIVKTLKNKKNIFAIGDKAYEMYEKAPDDIEVVFPMKSGVIARFDNMQTLLGTLLRTKKRSVWGSEYVVAVPTDVTEVEKKAFCDLVLHSEAKAKSVRIVERGLADAVGLGIDIFREKGIFIANFGGGITELSVLSSGGLVLNRLLKIGGDDFDSAITGLVRHNKEFLIGKTTAEMLRKKFGVFEQSTNSTITVSGRDLVTGVPSQTDVSIGIVRAAIKDPLDECVRAIKLMLDRTPPDVRRAIEEKGIYLTGGLTNLKGLPTYIRERVGLPVTTVDDPELCAVKGLQKIILDKEYYKKLTYSMLDEDYRWLR